MPRKKSRTYDLLVVGGILLVVGSLCLIASRDKLQRADKLRTQMLDQPAKGAELKESYVPGTAYRFIGMTSLGIAFILGIVGVVVVIRSRHGY